MDGQEFVGGQAGRAIGCGDDDGRKDKYGTWRRCCRRYTASRTAIERRGRMGIGDSAAWDTLDSDGGFGGRGYARGGTGPLFDGATIDGVGGIGVGR
ncbi:MAG: hypothetical protein MUO24_01825 [Desulfobacterales bacterium]|nr:hypothetical protein [Desulfobacterales bacterium]